MGWGGDPQSDWEGLAASIRGAQSWGMSGVPFYAHDIGVDLEEVAERNIEKVAKRYPNGFSAEASINRKE